MPAFEGGNAEEIHALGIGRGGENKKMKHKKEFGLIGFESRRLRGILSLLSFTSFGVLGDFAPVELMYSHPEGEDLEYLELRNRGETVIDLSGAQFTDGIIFTFDEVKLEPSESLVVAKDPFVFRLFYPEDLVGTVVGGYEGQLNNNGENIAITAANGILLLEFEYSDGAGWPGRADGLGSSLELRDGATDFSDSDSWRRSPRYGGAPGDMQRSATEMIVVNEVLTHTDPPFQDAIELKNLGPSPVDIGGWFLSDSSGQLDRYRIPNGTVIMPDAYSVFYEQELNFTNTRVPFSLSSAMGDKAILVSADSSGNPLFFIDDVSFGAAANGIPFGRFPDGTGPLVTLTEQTLGTGISPTDPPSRLTEFLSGKGAANADPLVGPIVVSKIMYHPPLGKGEFLELTNLTPFEFPLFDALAPTNRWRVSGAVSFEFPLDTRIPPQGKVILSNTSPSLFATQYPSLEADAVFGPYLGSLNNAGEKIRIHRPDFPLEAPDPDAGFVPYYLAEKLSYDDEMPWPLTVNGTGEYLVRRDLAAYGDDPNNWRASGAIEPGMLADSDGDGMWDEWEIANGLNPNSPADANADLDGDGFSNLSEFEASTDPNDSLDFLRISSVMLAVSGTEVIIRFEAREGIQYEVEQLAIPRSDQEEFIVHQHTGAAQSEIVEVSLPVESDLARYFRLQAQRTPQ